MQKTLDELTELNNQLKGLNEENPRDLQRIIMINTRTLQPLGKLYGNATKDFKYAYAHRKYAQGSAMVYSDGTGVEKTGKSEIGCHEARKKEAESEGEMVRWKFAYDSTKELIQSQKLVLRALITELENTNQMG